MCPVAAGAGDQAAGAVGVGVIEPGPVSLVLGTSGVVLRRARAVRQRLAAALVLPRAARRVAHDGRDALGRGIAARGSATSAAAIWASCCERPSAGRRAAEGLLFAPYLSGERSPHPDPDARGAWVGLSLRHDRGALARAVLEGVACGLGEILELVSALAGPPSHARVSGGGARSTLWLEIVASVLGVPVARMAVDEGAAYGAALLGGVAAGIYGSVAEAAPLARAREEIEPRADWVDAYASLRPRFGALYPSLRELRP